MMLGKTLRNRYKIIRQLGSGGFGETYLAEDLGIPVPVKPHRVVKYLKPHVQDARTIQLFKREAEALYKLGKSHPQIPDLLEYFEEGGNFFVIQDYIDGRDLSYEIIDANPWTEEKVIHLLRDILEILAYVHGNHIIHRDIKPSNIIRHHQTKQLFLIDFGAVKEVTTIHAVNQSATVVGTVGYMPEEQQAGQPVYASDIYAVGMIGVQALTGINPNALPFNAATGEKDWYQFAQISADFLEVLKKMTYRDYTQRYQNAQEALEAINNLKIIFSATDTQPQVRPTVMLPLLSKTKIAIRSNYPKIRFFLVLIIFSVITILIVASPFLYRHNEPISQPKPERAF